MKRYKRLFAFFLVAAFYLWLAVAATHYPLPSQEKPLIFYSNQKQQDLKLTLCHALKKAGSSISLQMYAITDPDVLHLLKKAQDRGIQTSILYDKSATAPLTELKATPYLGKGLMHRKIVVVDHSLVFLGSANMTAQSLKLHDNLLLGLFHPELASFLEGEHSTNPFSFSINAQPAELWMLPDKTGAALNRLIETIDSAQQQISIAIFTMTHPKIGQALLSAHKRGVKVEVIVDFFTEKGASFKLIQNLFIQGIPIYCSQGRQLLHHKWALIDQKKLIVGSANWTQAAFMKNKDCFLILENLTPEQKKFINSLWKIIKLESRLKEE